MKSKNLPGPGKYNPKTQFEPNSKNMTGTKFNPPVKKSMVNLKQTPGPDAYTLKNPF